MSAILIDANGARLATGGYDYDVKLWDFKFKFVNSNIYDYKNEVSKHTRVLLDIWLNTIVCQIKTRIILYISNLGEFHKNILHVRVERVILGVHVLLRLKMRQEFSRLERELK